jgi:hypothetical protein
MDTTDQELAELYASLPDERLAAIGLRGGLTPAADRAMALELQRRGITDLSPWREQIERDFAKLDARREKNLKGYSLMRTLTSGVFYGLAVIGASYGIYVLLMPQEESERGLGAILIILAAVFAAGTWLVSRIERFWHERVLFRPWWR